jgi:hypothetical protein
MSVFIRRFTSDPGNSVLLDIESVNILDLDPPGNITGVGSGTALLVGEYENGPFETVEEVSGGTDLVQRYGGFGYTYAGVVSNNPSARSRKADGALNAEFWNGNALIALNAKRFSRLLVARVDTSIGAVQFTRQASQLGAALQTWPLNDGDTLTYYYGDPTTPVIVSGATFNGVAALLTSAVGVYPSLFTSLGGSTLVLATDFGTSRQVGPVAVSFTAADQTQAQVIARINAAMGFTCAVDAGGGVTTFTGRVAGTTGTVIIDSQTGAPAPFTVLGIVAGTTVGTGNVGDISAVTLSEVNAVSSTPGLVEFDRGAGGELRMFAVAGSGVLQLGLLNVSAFTAQAEGFGFDSGPNPTTLVFGFGPQSSQPDGFAVAALATGTYPTLFVGGEQIVIGADNEVDVTVTFTALDQTRAQVAARINAAMGFTCMTTPGGVSETFTGRLNGGQFRVTGGTAAGLTAIFALTVADLPLLVSALPNLAMTLPAGTRVQDALGTVRLVTMQDISVRATGTLASSGQLASGPYSTRVRHGLDDGTGIGIGAFAIDTVTAPIVGAYFAVENPAPILAAMTEGQIDAAYTTAIEATNSVDTVASQTNLIWSARQSNQVRNALRQNVNDASANGCFGRTAQIRPPLGTTRVQAKGPTAPGVNAYRDQRVDYCFPGVQTFVSAIAARGLAGGPGFTADGVINVGSDGFLVSICSQLPPEENPGQQTTYALGALGIESNNPDVQNMGINDYIAFRANGIAAPRMSDGAIIFQSGITSVNPAIFPQFRNIARRRMADYIQDSLALLLKSFGKKLNTPSRRAGVVSAVRTFMVQLLSPGNAAAQRIDGFKLDPVTGNTPETLALGLFRLILDTRTLSSLDSIVLQTTIGEAVDVSEAA